MMINLLRIINVAATGICFLLVISILQCEQCKKFSLKKISFGMFLLALTSAVFDLILTLQLFFVDNMRVSNFLCRLSWIGAFVVASYTFLSLAISKQDKKANLIGGLQFVIAVLFTILAFTNLGIKKVISVFPLVRESGVMEPFFRLWIFVSICFSVYTSVKYYLLSEGVEKLKLKYFLLGIYFYSILGVLFNSILPLLKIEKFVQLTPIGSVVWVLASFYSIHYYKLLDIEVLFCDALKYGVFILIGVLLNYVFLQIFSEFLYLPAFVSSTLSLIIVGTIYFVTPLRERINNTIRNIVLRRRTTYQRLLEDTAKAVVEILDLDKLLEYVVKEIRNSLGATKICIFLRDEENKDEETGDYVYRLVASCGFENLKTTVFKHYKIINWLKQYQEPLLLDVAYHTFDESSYKELTESLHLFGAIIFIPILYKKELIGIITLDQKKVDGTIFDLEDIEILKTLAEQVAVAIQNSKMYHELNTAYMQTVRALAVTLESKDDYLIGHSDNVTRYAVLLAKKLDLPERDVYILAQAAVLHDLGKVGIHDYILNKPGKLTKEEWEEVKQHPIKGAKILQQIPFLNEVAKVVLHHHEHYDGTGYPDGLKGEQIPLLSRILTLADSVDAMMSERPYKERGLTVDEMLQEIISQKGRHFDPYLVDKFVEIVKEFPNLFSSQRKQKS